MSMGAENTGLTRNEEVTFEITRQREQEDSDKKVSKVETRTANGKAHKPEHRERVERELTERAGSSEILDRSFSSNSKPELSNVEEIDIQNSIQSENFNIYAEGKAYLQVFRSNERADSGEYFYWWEIIAYGGGVYDQPGTLLNPGMHGNLTNMRSTLSLDRNHEIYRWEPTFSKPITGPGSTTVGISMNIGTLGSGITAGVSRKLPNIKGRIQPLRDEIDGKHNAGFEWTGDVGPNGQATFYALIVSSSEEDHIDQTDFEWSFDIKGRLDYLGDPW